MSSLIAPWLDEVSNRVPEGTLSQFENESFVSATAQSITNGVTEAQMVKEIGEWSNAETLPKQPNAWKANNAVWGGGMVSEQNTVLLANRGIIGAELQVPRQKAHMVAIESIAGALGQFRILDAGIGATYTVNKAWKKYVSK
ncbi:hypothetical protein [Massilia rubra]|uniref:Uncharacterized protein n=1 Tax=Massilia rubra TaxID=2607910 RepID=A0ABX0LQJ9_9BURK|nr:hypothetical protein [Massilia rubra]NHZ36755.1 hypothetical protein [Massilia rubra]